MSEKSSIEWTDATWNPTRGCTKIAQGCKNCYAETFAERWRGIKGHPYEQGFDPRTAPDKLTEPLKWKKPRRIFVDSMSDLFHEAFDFNYIAACFSVMALASQHTFQVLTKRPERAARFFEWARAAGTALEMDDANVFHHFTIQGRNNGAAWESAIRQVEDQNAELLPLPNVWIGTSVATQTDADKNLAILRQIPAAVRFVSAEPLIEAISFRPRAENLTAMMDLLSRGVADKPDMLGGIDWLIVGGESGPGARPCNVEWIRSIVQQCRAASVPVFVKQDSARRQGQQGAIPDDLWIKEFPEVRR